jgi:hypothetical protein
MVIYMADRGHCLQPGAAAIWVQPALWDHQKISFL